MDFANYLGSCQNLRRNHFIGSKGLSWIDKRGEDFARLSTFACLVVSRRPNHLFQRIAGKLERKRRGTYFLTMKVTDCEFREAFWLCLTETEGEGRVREEEGVGKEEWKEREGC